jgi:hypothetical protein
MTKMDTTRQDRNAKKKDKNGKTYGSQKHIRQQEVLRSRTNNTTTTNTTTTTKKTNKNNKSKRNKK